MTLRDDLIAARALIDTPEKWRKDNSCTDPYSCCAVIAANRATGGFGYNHETARALADALPEVWLLTDEARIMRENRGYGVDDEPGIYVGEFNDNPATTHADIMALFDRAIAAADSTP